jgi:L-ascorbate metabolism protein UlaG (beta-lactamase superfamily)
MDQGAQAARRTADVTVTWLGVAGVLISDGKTGILVDPYVSRIDKRTVTEGLPLSPDTARIGQWVDRLGAKNISAVVVSLAHFDHVLDAPSFAKETGAPLMGSESTRNIGLGAGLPESQLVTVHPGSEVRVGDFTLRFIESSHVPDMSGGVPYSGTVARPLIPPRPVWDYKLGTVYSLLVTHPSGTLLHHGSAGFIPGMYRGVSADVVLMGISGRKDTAAYLAEVPLAVKARLVIPLHYDDFYKPLVEGISYKGNARFPEFCASAGAASLEVKTLPVGEKLRVLPRD